MRASALPASSNEAWSATGRITRSDANNAFWVSSSRSLLVSSSQTPPKSVAARTRESVRGIAHLGGTILRTTNRGSPFNYPVKGPDGQVTYVDRSDELVANARSYGIEAIVSIGGDGSLRIAQQLVHKGLKVVSVPKTIDNDVPCTINSFGFDTAVSTAIDAIAERLWGARSRGLVLSGSQDVRVQAICNVINQTLGAYGTTLDLAKPSYQRAGNDADLAQLRGELSRGEVGALFVLGVNPVFDLPDSGTLATDIKKVGLIVSTAERP